MESVWVTLFVCVACYAYNRKSVSFVSPKLIEDGLDRSDAGLILTCQNGAFALSKFVAGVLSDSTNPRHIFILGLILSGSATVLFSSASTSSISVLCGLWFLNGMAQGCGWPSCAKIIRQRASSAQFGTLWSVLSSANNVSGSLSPLLSSYLVLHYGWRTTVFTAGITSLVIAVFGAIALKLSLGDDGTQENEKSAQKKTAKETEAPASGGLCDLLCDPFLIMVSFGYFVVFCARSALLDWGQLYLIEERGRSHQEGSAFASSIETGGFLGGIAAGFITDRLSQIYTSKGISQSSIRLSVAVASMVGTTSLLHALQITVTEDSTTVWITSLGFLLGASLYGPIAIFGIVSTESAPAHLSGSSNAIAALAANLGAMMSGFPCCYLAKHYSWSMVFLLLEVATGVILFILFCFRNLQPKLTRHKKED